MSNLKYHDETLELSGRHVMIARIISRLTPAPLINLYVGIIMIYYSPLGLGPYLDPIGALLICIFVMVILPIAPILLEVFRGNTDLDVSVQESRAKFFAFSLVCYAFAYSIYWIGECDIMRVLAAAYLTVTTGVMIANEVIKVSVHGAGVGGPGTALLYVYGWLALPVVLVWVAVIWSRTALKQHTLMQAVAGVALGVLITVLTYLILYPL
ncbi:MAG: hypothetical protein ACFE7R_04125 [Candidatus Hodarchaeota archaeon]